MGFVISIFAACNPDFDSDNAQLVSDAYLSALVKNDLPEAEGYFSKSFNNSNEGTSAIEEIRRIQDELGPVLSFKLAVDP